MPRSMSITRLQLHSQTRRGPLHQIGSWATIVLLGVLALATPQGFPADPIPPPPPLLPAEEGTDAPPDSYLEPEVTITTRKDAVHYEYRINGRLYMIKVVPTKGAPYYLVDQDGTGEWRRVGGPDVAPPMWVLKRF